MRQWLKVLISAFVVIIVLLIAGIFVLTKAIDPAVYQHKIERYLHNSTGRDVKLLGEMKIDYFPSLGLDLPRLTIPNPEGFSGENFADIQQIKFKVRVLPLFLGKVEIGMISADKATFNLLTNADGKNNWSTWAKSSSPSHYSSSPSTKKSVNLPIRSLDISSFKISDSQVNIENKRVGFQTSIKNINFLVRNLSLGKPFPVHLAFETMSRDNPVKTSVKLEGTTSIDLPAQRITMPGLSIKTLVRRPGMPVLPIKLDGDFKLDNKQQTLDFSPLVIKIANMKVDEGLHVTHLLSVPHLKIYSHAENVSLGPLVRTLSNRDSVEGWLSFDSDFSGKGESLDQFLKTGTGNGNLSIRKGAIKGIDFSYLLDKAASYINAKPLPPAPKQPIATRFSVATASYKLRGGIISNRDLKLLADNFKADGKGSINLLKDSIDYNVLVSSLDSKSFSVPVKVSGSLDSPSFEPDWDSLAKEYLKGSVQDLLQDNGKKLKNALDSLLQ